MWRFQGWICLGGSPVVTHQNIILYPHQQVNSDVWCVKLSYKSPSRWQSGDIISFYSAPVTLLSSVPKQRDMTGSYLPSKTLFCECLFTFSLAVDCCQRRYLQGNQHWNKQTLQGRRRVCSNPSHASERHMGYSLSPVNRCFHSHTRLVFLSLLPVLTDALSPHLDHPALFNSTPISSLTPSSCLYDSLPVRRIPPAICTPPACALRNMHQKLQCSELEYICSS